MLGCLYSTQFSCGIANDRCCTLDRAARRYPNEEADALRHIPRCMKTAHSAVIEHYKERIQTISNANPLAFIHMHASAA